MTAGNHWDEEIRLLVESPYRLRFELGGESLSNVTQSIPRFIQAFTRARDVADAILIDETIVAVVGSPLPKTKLFPPDGDGFRALREIGFISPSVGEWRAPRYRGDGACLWKRFDIGSNRLLRDTLLWCSVSAEMAINPKVPVSIYLVEPTHRIMLHVYDDRGMDVWAAIPDVLARAYVTFDRWLLDHDRPRMAVAFKPGGT
jgi:hypothetical protein